jgi:hypothetical protein
MVIKSVCVVVLYAVRQTVCKVSPIDTARYARQVAQIRPICVLVRKSYSAYGADDLIVLHWEGTRLWHVSQQLPQIITLVDINNDLLASSWIDYICRVKDWVQRITSVNKSTRHQRGKRKSIM